MKNKEVEVPIYWGADDNLAEDEQEDSVVKRHLMKMVTLKEPFVTLPPYLEEISEKYDHDLEELIQVTNHAWVMTLQALKEAKTYEVSKPLCERLRATHIRGLHGRDLRLPFPCVDLQIPSGVDIGLGPTSVEMRIQIAEYQDSTGLRSWHFFIDNECEYDAKGWQTNGIDDTRGEGYVFLQESEKLQKIADSFCWLGTNPKSVKPREFIELLINVFMYATSRHVRQEATNKEWQGLTDRINKLPPGKKKERLKQRRRSLEPNYRIVLGRDIRPLGPSREGSSLTVRTLVSGHWRFQVYGSTQDAQGAPIPADQRPHDWIWIEPFWKGPELAPETNPTRCLL